MAEVRNELPYMQLPERYVRVKLKGQRGPVCICEPGEVSDFCDGMTQAEVEALPEFEGF